jgi:hypothetical protein
MSSPRPLRTYALAFLAGAAGAVLGWLLTGFAASYFAGLAGVSDMEGGRAMVSFLGIAPFGGLAGLLAGVWLVLRYQGGYRGFAGLAGRGAAVVAALAVATGLGLWAYSLSSDVLVTNGPAPQLLFEIRFPPNAVLPAKLEGVRVDLDTDKNTMPAGYLRQASDGGREVLSGAIELYFRTSHRIVMLRLAGQPDRLFVLKLDGNPGGTPDFGAWQPVDFIGEGTDGALRKGTRGDDYQIRYRVERAD